MNEKREREKKNAFHKNSKETCGQVRAIIIDKPGEGGGGAAVEAWTVIRWSTDKGLVCAVRLNGARFLRNAGRQPKPNLVPLTEERCNVKPMHELHKFYLLLSKSTFSL